jgi:phosphonate transport system substrate-binding protein
VSRAPLLFTSCQAPIAEKLCAGIVEHVGRRLGRDVAFVDGMPWEERLREFDAGRIDVCWMCGLPYVWRADGREKGIELLAALVPAGDRYEGRAQYFSDVVVRRDSPWSSFAGLEGAIWAYNEPTSHSGFNATRQRLAQMNKERGFFGAVVMAGSHESSLRRLLAGEVDATAVDSTVLDLVAQRDPEVVQRLRTIECFGPSPSPPWVIGRGLPEPLRAEIRAALLDMAGDAAGRHVLAAGLVARFAAVTDADYDPVRRIAREAQAVDLSGAAAP